MACVFAYGQTDVHRVFSRVDQYTLEQLYVAAHSHQYLWRAVCPLTVGIAIFAQSFETGAQWGTVTAATIMVIFPLLIAFFIFQKQFVTSSHAFRY